jgi:hypothetical protein
MIAAGGSPAAACEKLGVALEAVSVTLDADERFRKRINRIEQSLSENVKSALYRTAMKGNPSAQSQWLKLQDEGCSPAGEMQDDLASLSLEELQKIARQEAALLLDREDGAA